MSKYLWAGMIDKTMSFTRLLKLSRPRFWLYLFGPALLGAAAAVRQDAGRGDLVAILSLLIFTFPANLFLYAVNDIFDIETDRLNPKKQGYEQALDPKTIPQVLRAIILSLVPSIILLLLLPRAAFLSFCLFLFLGIAYSVPPLRLKARPFLDALSNVLYVLPGLVAWYAFGGGAINWYVVLAGSVWCIAMHAYSAVPDIEADRAAKLSTIATTLGKNGTLFLCGLLYFLAAGLASVVWYGFPILAGFIYLALMIRSAQLKTHDGLLAMYRLFPWINAVFGFVIFWWIVLGMDSRWLF